MAIDLSAPQGLKPGSMTSELIRYLARVQIAPWLLKQAEPHDITAELHRLNATIPNVFLFHLADGKAELIDRPASILPLVSAQATDRASGYRMWLNTVAREFLPDLNILLAFAVGDEALDDPDVPIFAFQKPAGNRCMLLPDPDMLGYDFPTANDEIPYLEKETHAIFVGATTGGLITTEALLRDGATQRIRSALFFRRQEDVSFTLPLLVQFDTPQTADLLRTMGFGDGQMFDWPTQLRNRFVISMDGNGAACTPVSITLSSNAVLLKYDSPHQLYYFPALQPWRHYIPISEDADVLRLIEVERKEPGFFSDIPVAAKQFTQDVLNRDAVMAFTVELIRLYSVWLAAPARVGAPDGITAPDVAQIVTPENPAGFHLRVHIQNHGDAEALASLWSGLIGSGQSIEGFALFAGTDVDTADLQYQYVDAEGVASSMMHAGLYAGTSGQNRPIHGFAIHLSGAAAALWHCEYSGRFVDGTEIGPIMAGALCEAVPSDAGNRAALEAMQVIFSPK